MKILIKLHPVWTWGTTPRCSVNDGHLQTWWSLGGGTCLQSSQDLLEESGLFIVFLLKNWGLMLHVVDYVSRH